jgi:hypothetical protein
MRKMKGKPLEKKGRRKGEKREKSGKPMAG